MPRKPERTSGGEICERYELTAEDFDRLQNAGVIPAPVGCRGIAATFNAREVERNMAMVRKLLTMHDIAERANLPLSTIYRFHRAGELPRPTWYEGQSPRFDPENVRVWIAMYQRRKRVVTC